MRQLEPDVAEHLLSAMSGARWFAGKGRRAVLTRLTPLPWLSAPRAWPAVRFEIAEVGYPSDDEAQPSADDPYELYQLAQAYYPAPQPDLHAAETMRHTDPELGPVVGYDAGQDRVAAQVLLDRLLAGGRTETGDAAVGFHLTDLHRLSGDLEPRPFRGQQSNTSMMYGDVAMIKLFRRLELGHNLDIEVHEALGRGGVSGVAALYGWIDGSWLHRGEPVQADLALVVEQLSPAEDGWKLALHSIQTGSSFTVEAAALGAALAETHRGLREAFGVDRHSGAATAATMAGRLEAAIEIAPALAEHASGLRACFAELGATDLDTQRVHGDFHLGQTLRTPSGWKLIDFEGEPAKTLDERKALDSGWRDIAGMLRSFDYAAASVPGADAAEWVRSCREAFLSEYAGGPISAGDAVVLRAYEADKAVYEVAYEVRNRPDWVAIPLRALSAVAATSPQPDHPAAMAVAGEKE